MRSRDRIKSERGIPAGCKPVGVVAVSTVLKTGSLLRHIESACGFARNPCSDLPGADNILSVLRAGLSGSIHKRQFFT